MNCQVTVQEMTVREPLMMRRNAMGDVKNHAYARSVGQVQRLPAYCLNDIRRRGGMTCMEAVLWEHGNSP